MDLLAARRCKILIIKIIIQINYPSYCYFVFTTIEQSCYSYIINCKRMKLQIIGRLNKQDKLKHSNIKQILATHLYTYHNHYQNDRLTIQPFQVTTQNTQNIPHKDQQSLFFREFFDKFYTVCEVKYDSIDTKSQKINRRLQPILQLVKSSAKNKLSVKCKDKTGANHQSINLKQGVKNNNPKIRKVNSSITISFEPQINNKTSMNKRLITLNKSFNKKSQKQSLRSSKRSQFNKENIDINIKANLGKICSKAKDRDYQRDWISQIRNQISQLNKVCKIKKK